MDFILINLQYQYSPDTPILDWADALLKAYPNRRGIVESHNILKIDNSWSNQSIYLVLKDNPNLFLMVCGHDYSITGDGAAYRAELGDGGHIIHIMLADYQTFSFFGNGGYLRILRFSPADDKIYVTTYSPYVNKYITSYPDQMEMVYDMPLPVELASFNAKTAGQSVILNWRTATEVSNYGFDIERASSLTSSIQSWKKIGFVFGAGNSNSSKYYEFLDNNPVGGSKFLYRLKQIDTDGKYEYSDIVEVELAPRVYELLQNYPNPFNPSTIISYSIPEKSNISLKIFNSLGSEVGELVKGEMEAGNYDVDFTASDLPSGVYFYRLQSGSFIDTKKMLLLK